MNATVSSSLSSESGNGHFKGGQSEQKVNSAQLCLHLYSDGSCGNIEVSKLTLNLTFLLHLKLSVAICECDQRLTQHQIS